MSARTEILKMALEQSEYTVSDCNLDRSIERLLLTNLSLAKLVAEKCDKLMHNFKLPRETRIIASGAANTIINVLEEPLEELEDMDFNYHAPCAHSLEEELYDAFIQAEETLLTRCWNDSMLHGGWVYVADNNEPKQFMPERTGWFVREEEKISVSEAIAIMAPSYLEEIERWINYFTKTIFVNTTTEEWAEAYGVDLYDRQAVKEMKLRIRKSLLGE